ncbi:transporter [Pseudoxanthomonas daejeonensis]|uniref:transporter n=1 Tax=Pseudoxanthomonas daejeonensis TaxID=266062 RepID=UPI001F5443A2|nr:transporter [Pseudoxanthomonas daejeonensis]UNK57826.1 transporter [Pseudoxanthomonas daejeonensis]
MDSPRVDMRFPIALRYLAALAFALLPWRAAAQEIEPRSYSNVPIGVNFLVAGAVQTRGGLSFDASVPITNEDLKTTSLVTGYARAFALWGQSAKFDVGVPYTRLSGSADYSGMPIERKVSGFGRPAMRLSVNFLGAPAMDMAGFKDWKQDLIVGASLQVAPPLGQYDPDRIVNIASNRWSFKPELGLSKASGPWITELKLAATFYTDNDAFYGGTTRSQDPLYALQGNLIRGLASGAWWSLDATYFAGGRSQVDGLHNRDLQQNWRVGASLSLPVDRRNSVKFAISSGVYARTGNEFDALAVTWQHRWGGGV